MDMKKRKILERPNKRQIPEQQESIQLKEKIGYNYYKAKLFI